MLKEGPKLSDKFFAVNLWEWVKTLGFSDSGREIPTAHRAGEIAPGRQRKLKHSGPWVTLILS
jgi:hypothetical protein